MFIKRVRLLQLVVFITGGIIIFRTISYLAHLTQTTVKGSVSSLIEPDSGEAEYTPPCGDVCSYTGTVINRDGIYPQLHRDINCDNIMRRMAWSHHEITYPPPETPPEGLFNAFTQDGDMPILKYDYRVDYVPGETTLRSFSKEYIDNLIQQVMNGENVNTYNDKGCLTESVTHLQGDFSGKSVVTIGSLRPWLESIFIAKGADHVTSLEYKPLKFEHPKLEVYSPYTYGEMYLNGTAEMFEFGASFCSLEHSGLGRYGDPINPYGDLEAMAQAWCMMKPGGIFILGIPGKLEGEANLVWNANRNYNATRLQYLTANWEVLQASHCTDNFPILILRKVES